MTERRSTDPSASRDIRNRAKDLQKHLFKEPCNVGKALGLYEALDGASLFKPPFQSPDRASHDAAQWTAREHRRESTCSGAGASPQISSRTRARLGRSIATWAPTRVATA